MHVFASSSCSSYVGIYNYDKISSLKIKSTSAIYHNSLHYDLCFVEFRKATALQDILLLVYIVVYIEDAKSKYQGMIKLVYISLIRNLNKYNKCCIICKWFKMYSSNCKTNASTLILFTPCRAACWKFVLILRKQLMRWLFRFPKNHLPKH